MKKPPVVTPGEDVNVVGRIFGAPLVVKDYTWLPLSQLGAWAYLTKHSDKPGRLWLTRIAMGFLKMIAMLGSEWLHNLAHAAAARLVDKPMDALRVTWGMPLVVYYEPNDPSVTPEQHIVRSLGGPVLNGSLLIPLFALRDRTKPDTAARELVNFAVGTNVFLGTAGLLPIPFFDGGPVLKWSLVRRGHSIEAAEQSVRKANRYVGAVLSIGSALALLKRKFLIAWFMGFLGAVAAAVGFGWIEE
jgi:Zn-dependent protease